MKYRMNLIAVFLVLAVSGCSKASATPAENSPAGKATAASSAAEKPLVTFIELGSVNCIPCKAMQPVMEEVRQKYGDQVAVLFYDVWTKEGEPYGQKYRIRVIPTQVFLDTAGKEYFRHEGFFPAKELFEILKQGGVKL